LLLFDYEVADIINESRGDVVLEPMSAERQLLALRERLLQLSNNNQLADGNELIHLCIQIDRLAGEINRKRRSED